MDQSRYWRQAGVDWPGGPVRGTRDRPKGRDFKTALGRIVEGEIIPRLMLTHRTPDWSAASGGTLRATDDDVARFVPLLLANDLAGSIAFIGALRQRGVSLESVFIDLMTNAARRLGERWIDDSCDFLQVTLAMANLRQLLHEVSLGYGRDRAGPQASRSVLLSAAPGETHTFGIAMVATFFRGAGWQVDLAEGEHTQRLLARVGDEAFGVVAFSLSGERNAEALAQLIRQVRRASRNPHIGILVGGPLVLEQPDYVVMLGADAMAANAAAAVAVAQNLLDLRACSC